MVMDANAVLSHAPHLEILERGGPAAEALIKLPGHAGDKLRGVVHGIARAVGAGRAAYKVHKSLRDDVHAANQFIDDIGADTIPNATDHVWDHLGAALRGRGLEGDDQSDVSEDEAGDAELDGAGMKSRRQARRKRVRKRMHRRHKKTTRQIYRTLADAFAAAPGAALAAIEAAEKGAEIADKGIKTAEKIQKVADKLAPADQGGAGMLSSQIGMGLDDSEDDSYDDHVMIGGRHSKAYRRRRRKRLHHRAVHFTKGFSKGFQMPFKFVNDQLKTPLGQLATAGLTAQMGAGLGASTGEDSDAPAAYMPPFDLEAYEKRQHGIGARVVPQHKPHRHRHRHHHMRGGGHGVLHAAEAGQDSDL